MPAAPVIPPAPPRLGLPVPRSACAPRLRARRPQSRPAKLGPAGGQLRPRPLSGAKLASSRRGLVPLPVGRRPAGQSALRGPGGSSALRAAREGQYRSVHPAPGTGAGGRQPREGHRPLPRVGAWTAPVLEASGGETPWWVPGAYLRPDHFERPRGPSWWHAAAPPLPSVCCSGELLLEKAMATHWSTLAWKIPWTEEPGRLQSMGSLRVRHD